jgi:hypothetical protein
VVSDQRCIVVDVFRWDFFCSSASDFYVCFEVFGCFWSDEGVVVVVFSFGYFGFDVYVNRRCASFKVEFNVAVLEFC